MKFMRLSVLVVVLIGMIAVGSGPAGANSCNSLLDHRMVTLQGKPQDLCHYEGKVVLIVNTASYCGYTPQYQALEAIFQKYKSQGFVVLGFPSNDFGRQEPGSNAEVADFCERTFRVKFPMFEKSGVTKTSTTKANPLYAQLAQLAQATGQSPEWNFHKYLVTRDGRTVKSFASKQFPDSPAFLAELEKFLAARNDATASEK